MTEDITVTQRRQSLLTIEGSLPHVHLC